MRAGYGLFGSLSRGRKFEGEEVVGCKGTEPGATGKETAQCISPNRKRGLKETWQASRSPGADFKHLPKEEGGRDYLRQGMMVMMAVFPLRLLVSHAGYRSQLPFNPVVCGLDGDLSELDASLPEQRRERSKAERASQVERGRPGMRAGRGLERRVAGSVKRKKRLPTCSRDPAIPCPVAQGMDEQQTTATSSRAGGSLESRVEGVWKTFEGRLRVWSLKFFASFSFDQLFPFSAQEEDVDAVFVLPTGGGQFALFGTSAVCSSAGQSYMRYQPIQGAFSPTYQLSLSFILLTGNKEEEAGERR